MRCTNFGVTTVVIFELLNRDSHFPEKLDLGKIKESV